MSRVQHNINAWDRRLIFGRRRGALCLEFEPTFEELDQSSAEESAVARNLRFDDRVSKRRAQFLASYIRQVRKNDPGLKMPDLFKRYFNEKIRYTASPRFLHSENATNLMRKFTPEGVTLFRVVELSGLLPLFRQWEKWHPLFYGAPVEKMAKSGGPYRNGSGWLQHVQNRTVVEWFERRLPPGDQRAGLSFLQAVLDGLNRHAAGKKPTDNFHPAWATTVDQIGPYLSPSNPHRLIHALGLHFERLPTWIMTLSYPAKSAGALARPTVLDGPSYCHFPSPAVADCVQGGHPMNLAPRARRTSELLSEFLHLNGVLRSGEVELAWFRIERSPRQALHRLRDAHFDSLEKRYDPPIDIPGWMPQCANPRWHATK